MFVARHVVFLGLLAYAIQLRVMATRGYPGGLWFGDTGKYLDHAAHLSPGSWHTSGYSAFLALLRSEHSLTAVVAVQHSLGVATGAMVYLLLRNRGIAAWWATLAAVPGLLDARLLQLETMLVSESPWIFFMMLGVTLGAWRFQRARWAYWITAPLAGLAVAAATLIRPPAALIVVLIAARLLYRRRTRWVTVALVAAFAIPVGSYAVWFHEEYGRYGLSNSDGAFLYGRTAAFADCAKIKPPAEEQFLCRPRLPEDSVVAPAFSALWGGWGTSSAFVRWNGVERSGAEGNALAKSFAKRAILKQPGDYLAVVWRDTVRSFRAVDTAYPTPATPVALSFPRTLTPMEGNGAVSIARYLDIPHAGADDQPRVVEPHARQVRDYKAGRWTSLPGPALLLILLVAPVGMVVRRRWIAVVPWLTAWSLLVVPAAMADFDPRYIPPAVPFAALALGLAPPWRAAPHRWRAPMAAASAAVLAAALLVTWPGPASAREAKQAEADRRQLAASLESLRTPDGLFRPSTATNPEWSRRLPFPTKEKLTALYASYYVTQIRSMGRLPTADPRMATGLAARTPDVMRATPLDRAIWLVTLKQAGGTVQPGVETRIRGELPRGYPRGRELTPENARHWLLSAQLANALNAKPPTFDEPEFESWTATKRGRAARGIALETMKILGRPLPAGTWRPDIVPEVQWKAGGALDELEGAASGLTATGLRAPDMLALVIAVRLDAQRACPGAPALYQWDRDAPVCDLLATHYALRIDAFTAY
ncbi:phospholipid carrier-dependent glycosyltransferase [Actinomadura sp. 6N118]|uniref:phospholipid carrier-dependent glycosyltransferase n=1 Tax=Actinomadura sp. 6N118 TaxID=3375151 RepID=UPI0037BDD815